MELKLSRHSAMKYLKRVFSLERLIAIPVSVFSRPLAGDSPSKDDSSQTEPVVASSVICAKCSPAKTPPTLAPEQLVNQETEEKGRVGFPVHKRSGRPGFAEPATMSQPFSRAIRSESQL